jgi:hypothetical protein
MSAAVLYQTMPQLSPDEYSNLEQSIRDHGMQVPVIVDEFGVIIDGHHRQKIAQTLGIDCPTDIKTGMTDAEKRSLSISLNIDRRQLSREQRRVIIEANLRAEPQLSDREHAKRAGVSPSTVGAVRDGLERDGELSKLDSRVSADGRERPATQPAREPEPESYWSPEESFVGAHPITGEVIEPTTVTETHTVKTVTGLDGKTYKTPEPKQERRASIIDAARTAGWELRKAVERLERIKSDDRFTKNEVEIMAALQPHLDFATEVFADL